jgi:hypothetical protein
MCVGVGLYPKRLTLGDCFPSLFRQARGSFHVTFSEKSKRDNRLWSDLDGEGQGGRTNDFLRCESLSGDSQYLCTAR